MKIVELKTPQDFHIHGPLSRTFSNQLNDRFGKNRYTNIVTDPHNKLGSIKTSDGKHFDWFINDDGDLVTFESK